MRTNPVARQNFITLHAFNIFYGVQTNPGFVFSCELVADVVDLTRYEMTYYICEYIISLLLFPQVVLIEWFLF